MELRQAQSRLAGKSGAKLLMAPIFLFLLYLIVSWAILVFRKLNRQAKKSLFSDSNPERAFISFSCFDQSRDLEK